jgi:MoaA/NifB/PqqE/SkfB family radical SAM enzyme
MCYYAHQTEKKFYHLDTLMARANMACHHYDLDYCDISGGEPTIYPGIEKLVEHCANIGLKPTIITHGQNNKKEMVNKLENAGLEDWLISIHGMKTGHDAVVKKGTWAKLIENLDNCQRPKRFNTTIVKQNYRELPILAKWLVENQPVSVWNMIQFNPFFDWQDEKQIDFQVQMSEMRPYIQEAVEIAESHNWEVNVRYFPFCAAGAFARNCINYYQTQYDPWEWCLVATNRVSMQVINQFGGMENTRRAICDNIAKGRENDKCNACIYHPICEGPSEQYQQRFGLGELLPIISGEPERDILHFEKQKEPVND